MPIQHGADAVLRRMRRPERADTIRSTVARVREAVPSVALRTTCIVGFPGETEDDLERLLDLLEEVAFERVGVFAYSPQEGTRAWAMADDVPDAVKSERLERVTEHQRLITTQRYEQRVGQVAQAIVDASPEGSTRSASDGMGRGRLIWQADDIDGITHMHARDVVPGSIVEVCVDDVVDDYDFRATVRRTLSAPSANGRNASPRALPVIRALSTGSYGR
jgi:ribosomal protein S12 methylthiotransferase